MGDDRYTIETKSGLELDTSDDLEVAITKSEVLADKVNEVVFVFDEASRGRIVHQAGEDKWD